jgi:hypothetical protein
MCQRGFRALPSKSESGRCANEAFVRGFPQNEPFVRVFPQKVKVQDVKINFVGSFHQKLATSSWQDDA